MKQETAHSAPFLVTASEMRELDRATIEDFGLPGLTLMENAARGAVEVLAGLVPDLSQRKVAVFAGKGNNGGDGYVMARTLVNRGVAATVYLLARPSEIRGDAAVNLALLHKMDVPVRELPDLESFSAKIPEMDGHDVIVDAILGTGISTPVRGLFGRAVEYINSRNAFRFAVDVPSGLFSDTGEAPLCVKADATATFGFAKIGCFQHPGAERTGRLSVLDIGIPRFLTERNPPGAVLLTHSWASSILQQRKPDAHKGDTGHALVVAGSPGKTGAAALCAISALRAGAGLVTLCGPVSLLPVFEGLVREAMTAPLAENLSCALDIDALPALQDLCRQKKALAIGPGIGTEDETKSLVRAFVPLAECPLVIDADGLNCLAGESEVLRRARAPLILTPHPGEMSRLTGLSTSDIQKDRVSVARGFAVENGVIVVLKGAGTVIASPDGRVAVNSTGNPGMAAGGMGDVLTGIIVGLAAQGYSPEAAARLGVFLHGLAADRLSESRGPFGYLAGEVAEELPSAFSDLISVHEN
ncbi:MAG: NAD(P)H-hydrate dehydratase [Thermodesulfobacteriota bacterium]